jgi:hypothetical protein
MTPKMRTLETTPVPWRPWLLAGNGGWVSSTPETEIQMGMGYPVVERVAQIWEQLRQRA